MNMQVFPNMIANSDTAALSSTLLNRDTYLVNLLNKVSASKRQGWLQELKDLAANYVRHSVIPNTREEEWRFTDLSALRKLELLVGKKYDLSEDDIPYFPEAKIRLVFINSIYTPELSTTAKLPSGVLVSNLASLPLGHIKRVQQYIARSKGDWEVFTALNTAGINDVGVVWISENVVLEEPIHIVFITAGEEAAISQPRCLVVGETSSQATLVEEHTNYKNTKGVYFSNSVTEIFVNKNAQINHTRIQADNMEAFHIGKTTVTQEKHSSYNCHSISLGGKLSRHNLEILQAGEDTETTLKSLTIIGGQQLADTHSAILLNHPHGKSRQLHKYILVDNAHGIFSSKVVMSKSAQLNDVEQLNHNLLLSPKARVDTKPQLLISADNVKCSHGATTSQLEDNQIFYLKSRSLNEDSARKLLIQAFAAEIINRISLPSLQERLVKTVNQF